MRATDSEGLIRLAGAPVAWQLAEGCAEVPEVLNPANGETDVAVEQSMLVASVLVASEVPPPLPDPAAPPAPAVPTDPPVLDVPIDPGAPSFPDEDRLTAPDATSSPSSA